MDIKEGAKVEDVAITKMKICELCEAGFTSHGYLDTLPSSNFLFFHMLVSVRVRKDLTVTCSKSQVGISSAQRRPYSRPTVVDQ